MVKSKAKKKGWKKEPARHALASKGIKTKKSKPKRPRIPGWKPVYRPPKVLKGEHPTLVKYGSPFCPDCGTLVMVNHRCPICFPGDYPDQKITRRMKIQARIEKVKDKIVLIESKRRKAKNGKVYQVWNKKRNKAMEQLAVLQEKLDEEMESSKSRRKKREVEQHLREKGQKDPNVKEVKNTVQEGYETKTGEYKFRLRKGDKQ